MKPLLLLSIFSTLLVGCVFTSSLNTTGSIVSVETRVPGASAEAMETSVVKPIESVLVKLEGVEEVRSRASEGRSYFEVYFKTKEPGKHLLLVQRAVEALQPSLPPLASASVVAGRESQSLR